MLKTLDKNQVQQAKYLLQNNDLPLDGFPTDTPVVIGAFNDEKLIGCAALEIHGDYGLLRSVVVLEENRGEGVGNKLINAILAKAAHEKLKSIYLLTETAENYFPRHGFVVLDRNDVPNDIKNSVEFTSACPDSATAMMKSIQ